MLIKRIVYTCIRYRDVSFKSTHFKDTLHADIMSLADAHSNKLKLIQTNQSRVAKHLQRLNTLIKKRESLQDGDVFDLLDLDDEIGRIEDTIRELQSHNQAQYLMQAASVFDEFRSDHNSQFTQDESQPDTDMSRFVEQRIINNKGQLFSKYMHAIEGVPMAIQPITDTLLCSSCDTVMKMCTNESYIVCDKCGDFVPNFEHSVSGLTYEQELNTDTNTHFSYKRINHLRELLSQLQAKESSNVPEDIIHLIKAEFIKERIQDASSITKDKVKKILKKLGLNKYYEHSRQITNLLSGKPPPIISNQLYEKIIHMFIEIQGPFETVCPKNRKNFFSYNYILYKFCELLDQREHMELFPLLKSREKLYQQDCIWKDICEIKNWPFIKSV